jgi:hypothetical protein
MRYSGKVMGMMHPYSLAGIMNFFLTITEVLLLVRVFLKFFFTTAGGGFVQWAFSTTSILLEPFRGVFPNPTATPGNWHVDFVALFAMAAYAAFGSLLMGLVGWNFGWKRDRR